jgi:hypothetical protein
MFSACCGANDKIRQMRLILLRLSSQASAIDGVHQYLAFFGDDS